MSNKNSATIAAHYMTQAAGPQYYDTSIVLKSLKSLFTQWNWCWFWIMGIIGLYIVPFYSEKIIPNGNFLFFLPLGY
ncbi:MAG: hypothetical protein ACRCXC_02555 [Legionella sp.]